jgi:hypothetical protein
VASETPVLHEHIQGQIKKRISVKIKSVQDYVEISHLNDLIRVILGRQSKLYDDSAKVSVLNNSLKQNRRKHPVRSEAFPHEQPTDRFRGG